jgi:hypothetical protein
MSVVGVIRACMGIGSRLGGAKLLTAHVHWHALYCIALPSGKLLFLCFLAFLCYLDYFYCCHFTTWLYVCVCVCLCVSSFFHSFAC